jgi:predicted heme/steroid binding protein
MQYRMTEELEQEGGGGDVVINVNMSTLNLSISKDWQKGLHRS